MSVNVSVRTVNPSEGMNVSITVDVRLSISESMSSIFRN